MSVPNSPLVRHVEAVHSKYASVSDSVRDPLVQLFAAINFIEWWVRFCTAGLLAAVEKHTPYRQHGDTAGLLWAANDRQTFGHAVGLLQTVATFVNERRHELSGGLGSQPILRLVDELSSPPNVVSVRNELIGHGVYDPTGQEYREALTRLGEPQLRCRMYESAARVAVGLVDQSAAELFPFFDLSDAGAVGVLIRYDITQDCPRAVRADFSGGGRPTVDGREPFHQPAIILAHKADEDDPSWVMRRATEEFREAARGEFKEPTELYARIARYVEQEDDCRLYLIGPAGVGKSVLAAFAEEVLDRDRGAAEVSVLVVPLREHLCRTRYFFRAWLALECGLPMGGDWDRFVVEFRERLSADERSGRRLVVWLDGLDELPQGEAGFFRDLADQLGGGRLRWVFAGRPPEEIANEFKPALANKSVYQDVWLDPNDDDYRRMLREFVEDHAPAADREAILAGLSASHAPTFLETKRVVRLAELGHPPGGVEVPGGWLAKLLSGSTPELHLLGRVLRLLSAYGGELTLHELAALLEDEWTWDGWEQVRCGVNRYDFLLRRSGSLYRLAHETYRLADCATVELTAEVTNRLVARHFQRRRMDLHHPSKLKAFWLRGLGGLSSGFTPQQLDDYLLTDDPTRSFFWARYRVIGSHSLKAAEKLDWTHLTDLHQLAGILATRGDERRLQRVFDHLIPLFACGVRAVEWEADAVALDLAISNPDRVARLFALANDFGTHYAGLENAPDREKTSAFSTLIGLLGQIRADGLVWNRERNDSMLADLTRRYLDRPPVWLQYRRRLCELFMASCDDPAARADFGQIIFAREVGKAGGLDADFARSVIEGLGEPATWLAFCELPAERRAVVSGLALSPPEFDLPIAGGDIRKLPPDRIARYRLQLSVLRLGGWAFDSPHDRNYVLLNWCSNDWADRQRLFTTLGRSEEAAGVGFALLDEGGKAGIPDGSVLPFTDPTARRGLYDLMLQFPELAAGCSRLVSRVRQLATRTADPDRRRQTSAFATTSPNGVRTIGTEADYLAAVLVKLDIRTKRGS